MKIAIVGTGIAGNVAAYKLRKQHDITAFESGAHIGGHTNTVDVYENGRPYAVDTGLTRCSHNVATFCVRRFIE